MKNLVDIVNESVNNEVNFRVSLNEIKAKAKEIESYNLNQNVITDGIEDDKKQLKKVLANKYRNLKIEFYYTKNISFIMNNREIFSINFKPVNFVDYFELEFGSVASYGGFNMNDNVFNIYKTIGNLLNDTQTLDAIFKYFYNVAVAERVLQDMEESI